MVVRSALSLSPQQSAEDWEQLEQEIAESRVHLEQHELQMFQVCQQHQKRP